jgi:hypothetical protein
VWGHAAVIFAGDRRLKVREGGPRGAPTEPDPYGSRLHRNMLL